MVKRNLAAAMSFIFDSMDDLAMRPATALCCRSASSDRDGLEAVIAINDFSDDDDLKAILTAEAILIGIAGAHRDVADDHEGYL